MRSVLAQRIIEACLEAKAAGAIIPSCDSLMEISWGISMNSTSEVYELIDTVCCPLGAVLLGNNAGDPTKFPNSVAGLLGVDAATINGILYASREGFFGENVSDHFKEGWAVGLEVLKWVNSQQKGA